MIKRYGKTMLYPGGIQIYPDFNNPLQFWYIPSTLQLADRSDGHGKSLSYLWYVNGPNDHDGEGFLNFVVNSAVDNNTQNGIKAAIPHTWPETAGKTISLNPVPYTSGTISVVALKALDGSGNKAIKVWDGGTPSLIGDNQGLASVTFTQEGKLAAAMDTAIRKKLTSVMAAYALKYRAMTPAISFKVTGSFTTFHES